MPFKSLSSTVLCLLLLSSVSHADWIGKADRSACPSQYISVTHSEEHYASESACRAGIAEAQDSEHLACARYWCESGDGEAATGGGSTDSALINTSSRAVAEGLVNGDAGTFGVGLAGMGVAALFAAPSGPSPAQVAAQRQAAHEADVRAAEAEAARKRQFEAEKQEAMDDMKDLKDAPNSPPKKKVKIIHLKPTEDILHRQPLPGDSTAATLFPSWEAAEACGGTAGLDKASGMVACCVGGFPYYCSGRCYKEAALDNMRIPCGSTLTTIKMPTSELK